MVTAVDMAVGTLHQELENQGLLDNAIIVFTSDVRVNMSIIYMYTHYKQSQRNLTKFTKLTFYMKIVIKLHCTLQFVYNANRCNMNGDKSTFSLLFLTITGTQINSHTG